MDSTYLASEISVKLRLARKRNFKIRAPLVTAPPLRDAMRSTLAVCNYWWNRSPREGPKL